MAFPTINNGLEYHWLLNGNATDEIGVLDLTEAGGVTYVADVPGALSEVLSQSASLDGVNDKLDSISGVTFRSISAWIKIEAFNPFVAVRCIDWSSTNFYLWALASESLRLVYPDAGNTFSQMADVTGVQTGVWYHFVWVGSPTTNTLYINGVAHDATADGFFAPAAQKLVLGYSANNGAYLQCKFSDVRLYSTQLTASDVAEIYDGDYNPGHGRHTHTAGSPTLNQQKILRPPQTQHLHIADSPTVSKVVPITPDACSHAHIVDVTHIDHVHVVNPNSSRHAHTAGSPTLAQQRILRPVATRHSHTAGLPLINGIASNTGLLLQRRRMAL